MIYNIETPKLQGRREKREKWFVYKGEHIQLD